MATALHVLKNEMASNKILKPRIISANVTFLPDTIEITLWIFYVFSSFFPPIIKYLIVLIYHFNIELFWRRCLGHELNCADERKRCVFIGAAYRRRIRRAEHLQCLVPDMITYITGKCTQYPSYELVPLGTSSAHYYC